MFSKIRQSKIVGKSRYAAMIGVLAFAVVSAGTFMNPARAQAVAVCRPGMKCSPTVYECLKFKSTLVLKKSAQQIGCVASLQGFYSTIAGYNFVKVDGIFGDDTAWATLGYQLGHPPLKVDGVVGLQTWNQIEKDCHAGPFGGTVHDAICKTNFGY